MTASAQEAAWKGQFGNDYQKRSPGCVEWNIAFFEKVFPRSSDPYTRSWTDIQSILELGAGRGANIKALRRRFPGATATGVELNQAALRALRHEAPEVNAIEASVTEWTPETTWDLVLTKGLLIHIPPAALPVVYGLIYRASSRYILIAEYYNPTPVEVEYRGEKGLLFKRDFAGEMLDLYPDLSLWSYGFSYHRDQAPQDDLTWFLLEKQHGTR